MDQRSVDYYTRRERQARQLAANATEPATQAAHLQMADAYGQLLAEQAAHQLHQRIDENQLLTKLRT